MSDSALDKFDKKWKPRRKKRAFGDVVVLSCYSSDRLIKEDCLSYFQIVKLKRWTPIGLYRKCVRNEVKVYTIDKSTNNEYIRVANFRDWVDIHKEASDFSGEEFDIKNVLWQFRYKLD